MMTGYRETAKLLFTVQIQGAMPSPLGKVAARKG